MPILTLIIVLVIVGVLLWLMNKYIPMQPEIQRIINIVAIVAVVIWILKVTGLWTYLMSVTI